MNTLNLKSKIFDAPGFSKDVRLTPDELAVFRDAITEQWLSVIGATHPELVSQFREVGISNYHQLAHLLSHETLWPKQTRCLPKHSCDKIKVLPFFQTLRDELGEFAISDVFYGDTHEAGREEIYWRLVRPNAAKDVGSLHADKWFHDVMGMDDQAFSAEAETVKIWIPIFSQPGKNGLMIVPNSHRKSYRYHAAPGAGGMKPVIDEDVETLGAELMLTEPGNMLIFNEGILHGGAVNMGDQTRVSVEITMVFANRSTPTAQ
ncbi:phytanoyl-CoA dioxygenase family protein [Herbaspirillum sp. NPDC101396]|uniref:phytanoyl-CoA dioxygenase family protein n=1 Tax=Herbaspirillum sp. NPDC101396 TaxID=3364005 RepID=UPI00383A33A7